MKIPVRLAVSIWCCVVAATVTVPALAEKDACTLVTTDEVSAALGEPVGAGMPQGNSTPQGPGSMCRFRSTQTRTKSVSVSVQYSNDDLTGYMTGMADNLKSNGMKDVHPVGGVGDGAIWATNTMLGRSIGELVVRKGKHVMLIVILNGLTDEAMAIDHAKTLAIKALPRT